MTVESATNIKYTGPRLPSSATAKMIRARVFTPDLLPGESDAQCYLLLDNSSVNFSAAMPVVAITTFGSESLVRSSIMSTFQRICGYVKYEGR